MDPISDIFRTMHITAFGQHRLEATAPWGLTTGESRQKERVPPSSKTIPPTDVAHFAMVSRGNCWLSCRWHVSDPIPLTGGDCFLAGPRHFDRHARQPTNTSKVNLRCGRRQGNRQCRSLRRRRRTNDHSLWILQFRSRQRAAYYSAIAEASFLSRPIRHARSLFTTRCRRCRQKWQSRRRAPELSRLGWRRFYSSRFSGHISLRNRNATT